MAQYFVIGSNSFSGSSLIKYLLQQGSSVIGVSRSPENPKPLLAYSSEALDQYQFWQCDLNRDLSKIVSLIEDSKPTYVINFSAQGMVAESWHRPLDWFATNVMATVELTESLRKFDFIEKFLQFTTPEVYGNIENWTRESFNFAPTTPYAVSRAASDMHLRSYQLNYGFPVIFTRAANVFGPSQQLYRIIPKTVASILLRKRIELHGGGLSRRSFINMSDVSSALYQLLEEGRVGDTYHISTLELVSIKQLVEMICEMMDYDFGDLVVDTTERMGKDFAYSLDSSKIRNHLGWSEEKTLEEGLEECIHWARNHLDFIGAQSLEYEHKA